MTAQRVQGCFFVIGNVILTPVGGGIGKMAKCQRKERVK